MAASVPFKTKLVRLGLILAAALLSGAKGTPQPVAQPPVRAIDVSYKAETTWQLPGLPDLSAAAGYIPHNFSHGEAIFQFGNETIHGFRPGKVYKEMYIRDIAWGMETAQYYYPDEYLREPIEAYLRRQYTANSRSSDGDYGVIAGAGAIGGIITQTGESNKQTITTDEETSLIHAAYLYYNLAHNVAWLHQEIAGRTIIDRLNLAADWLYANRLDPDLQLFWRGHTTDWGDVKFEPGPNYTDYNPAQDHLTASIYDQALAYLALRELAEMNEVAGNAARAADWQSKAEALKSRTNELLWQANKGFYLTHAHITPLDHPFDESAMVSIANALTVYAGLTGPEQAERAFQQLEAVRVAVGASKPGVSLYPYYPNRWPNRFFEYLGMGHGTYQNGAVWDWWSGVQIQAEFLNGFTETGRTHLLQVMNDWKKHPGNIIEWESSIDPRFQGSHYYTAAAGTMGSAIIKGFFGLTLAGDGLTMSPRLGLYDGSVRIYQAATDRYAAYHYDWDQPVTRIDYGTNAADPVQIKILKLRSEQIQAINLDGQPIAFTIETVGQDSYLVFNGPTGQHQIEIIKGQPGTLTAMPSVDQAGSPQIEVNAVQPLPQPAAAQDAESRSDMAGVEEPSVAVEPPVSRPFSLAEAKQSVETLLSRDYWLDKLDLLEFASSMLVIFPALILIIILGTRGMRLSKPHRLRKS